MRWVEFGVALPKKNRLCPQKPPITRWSWKNSTGMSWDISTSPACCMCDGTWGSQGPQGAPRGPRWYPPLPIFLFVHLDSLMHSINFYLCYPFYLVFSKTFLELCKITCQLLQDFNSGAVTLLLLQLAGAMRGPMGRPISNSIPRLSLFENGVDW